jgi:hypothetical protein
MQVAGEAAVVTGATPQAQICPRCGSFAVLRTQLGRSFCAECWARVIEPGVSVGQVLGDVRRLSARLLLKSWLALILVHLPLILGGALYRVNTGKAVPFQASSLYYFVTLFAVGAIIDVSHQVLMADRSIDWSAAWRLSTRRWGAMLGAAWLSGILTFAFALLLVIPGIVRALSYFITTPIALHEGGTASATIEQSRLRTYGHRWSILGASLALSAMGFIPILLFLGLIGGVIGVIGGPAISVTGHLVIDAVSQLLIQGPMALIYFMTAALYARCSVEHE